MFYFSKSLILCQLSFHLFLSQTCFLVVVTKRVILLCLLQTKFKQVSTHAPIYFPFNLLANSRSTFIVLGRSTQSIRTRALARSSTNKPIMSLQIGGQISGNSSRKVNMDPIQTVQLLCMPPATAPAIYLLSTYRHCIHNLTKQPSWAAIVQDNISTRSVYLCSAIADKTPLAKGLKYINVECAFRKEVVVLCYWRSPTPTPQHL